mgnify:CR=1 FL=1
MNNISKKVRPNGAFTTSVKMICVQTISKGVDVNSVSSITLADLDLFANGAPWSVFETLRTQSPVHWNEEEKPNSGFYSVTSCVDSPPKP